jgi:hypothetical protein
MAIIQRVFARKALVDISGKLLDWILNNLSKDMNHMIAHCDLTGFDGLIKATSADNN